MTTTYVGPDYVPILVQGLRTPMDGSPEKLRSFIRGLVADSNHPWIHGRGWQWKAVQEQARLFFVHWDAEACSYVFE